MDNVNQLSGTNKFLAQFHSQVIPGILSTPSGIPAIGRTQRPMTGTSFFILSLKPSGNYIQGVPGGMCQTWEECSLC